MSENKHILSDYEHSLKKIKKSVLTMASIAADNLRNSIKGLLERREEPLNDAIVEDEEVNAYERSIDREGTDILLRFNPVATDLRTVIASMKIATNLERIADQAENIARRARKILHKPEVAEARLIEPVFALASGLLDDAIRSFSEGDEELALTLYHRDQELDKLHRKTLKKYMKLMEEDVENLRTYLNLIFIVRCLERVGDHSVNIGEDTVYMVSAEDIRHVGPEEPAEAH